MTAETASLRDGVTLLSSPLAPGLSWVAAHDPSGYEEGRRFTDAFATPWARQLLRWRHVHSFEPATGEPAGAGGPAPGEQHTTGPSCRVTDQIDTNLPGAARLSEILAYRARQLAGDLDAHARLAPPAGPLTVAITGSSGLIGSALTAFLAASGHRVVRLVRGPTATPAPTPGAGSAGAVSAPVPSSRFWDPGDPDPGLLDGVDALVHLAGAPIAGRFSSEHKRRLYESRIGPTRALATLAAAAGVGVMVCASAVGFYGPDRGDEVLNEESGRGSGFLAGLVGDWEAATDPARDRAGGAGSGGRASGGGGTRVVNIRTGIVLSPAGGVLQPMRLLFSSGLGGRLGPGAQWLPWIGIDDIVDVYLRCIVDPHMEGPVNAAAPNPVTNADFTATLARVLRRPAAVAVPEVAPALLFGREGAAEFVLAGQRAVPAKLAAAGHTFRYPDLEPALGHVLGRAAALRPWRSA